MVQENDARARFAADDLVGHIGNNNTSHYA